MKLLKADLEQLVDIVIFLIKQAPIAPVRRGGRGDVEPGLGSPGKPGGMDPPQGSEGRQWKDYVPTEKKPEPTPEPAPEPKPEPRRSGKKKKEEPKPGYHKSGRKKGFGRFWQ